MDYAHHRPISRGSLGAAPQPLTSPCVMPSQCVYLPGPWAGRDCRARPKGQAGAPGPSGADAQPSGRVSPPPRNWARGQARGTAGWGPWGCPCLGLMGSPPPRDEAVRCDYRSSVAASRGQPPAWAQDACECGRWAPWAPRRPSRPRARFALSGLHSALCWTHEGVCVALAPRRGRSWKVPLSPGSPVPGLGGQVRVGAAERCGESQASPPNPQGHSFPKPVPTSSPIPSMTSSPLPPPLCTAHGQPRALSLPRTLQPPVSPPPPSSFYPRETPVSKQEPHEAPERLRA